MDDDPDLEELFHAARGLRPGPEREAYLDAACADHPELRAELEVLLESASRAAEVFGGSAGPRRAEPLGESTGDQIGSYKLLECLGEGGMGTVWMCEQREPVKRRVALKLIKFGMDTKQVLARFDAERQALALMDHPNIAKVLEAGATEAGRPYFAMEYIRGVPILEYCDTGRLDTKARLTLFSQVCQAIQHAHQKGVIHRDIKPGNVLVTLHDGEPVPKVIDFGIAKATNAELTTKTLFTEHRQMIGTPGYMSPEQAEMSGLDVDTRTDVYALGVLLYELLTGTAPFDVQDLLSRGLAEMLRVIREVEPVKPSTRFSSLGDTGTRTAQQRGSDVARMGALLRGDLDWIVMKCLEKDRTRRYESAGGLVADIRRHLNDEPVEAGPPSAGYRLRKFVKRNRGGVTAAAVVALAVLVGIVGTTTGLLWALDERDRADASAEQARLASEGEKQARVEAQENEQRALEQTQVAKRELARAVEIKRLISEMLQSVNPSEAQGADITLLKGILDTAAARLKSGEITDDVVAAELHQGIGNVYASLGLFALAEAHLPVAVELQSRVLGEEHPDTLEAMSILVLLYHSQGRFAEAESLCVKTLEIQQRVLGEEHPSTLWSMDRLANLYRAQSRYAEAEPLLLETLDIRKRVLGEVHESTLSSMNNLANLYVDQGRYAEAAPLRLEFLEVNKGTLGLQHPETLLSMNNLANLYHSQGRYVEAEPLFLETLDMRRRVLGEEHPDTLASMFNLANQYRSQGRDAEAEPLFLETLEIQRRVLGEEHSDTLGSIHNLALLYSSQDRNAEAEPLFFETLEIQKRVLGEEHPETLACMGSLAGVYTDQGRYAEAEPLYVEALETMKRVMGDERPETLATITNLGSFYRSIGRYEDAAAMYETSLPAKRRVLGLRHPWTRIAINGLARSYEALGRRDDALPLRRELLDFEVARAEQPDASADALNHAAWELLTYDVEELRDPARALEFARRACALGDWKVAANLDTLALAQHRTGDTAAAVATLKLAVEVAPTDETLEATLATYEAALSGESGATDA